MSAWLVTKKHIDVLVFAMVNHGIIILSTTDYVGRMLWSENYRSIRSHWAGGDVGRRPVYHYQVPEESQYYGEDAAGTFYKQARCYRYQSSEHNGWSRSRANYLTEILVVRTAKALGYQDVNEAYNDPRVAKAPWGV